MPTEITRVANEPIITSDSSALDESHGAWTLPPLEKPVRIVSWNVAAWATTVTKIRESYGNSSTTPNSTHNALTHFLEMTDATILCLQETKVTHKRVSTEPYACGASEQIKGGATAPISGWETFWATNKASPGFNGVATYVKEGMTLFADPRPLRVPELDDEGRCLLTIHKHFAVFNIYAPYSRDGERHAFKFRFYIALLKAMARVRSEFAVDSYVPSVWDAPDESPVNDGAGGRGEAANSALLNLNGDAIDSDGSTPVQDVITYSRIPPPSVKPIPIILVGDFNLVRNHRDMHWTKWSIPLDYWLFLLTGVRERGKERWWEEEEDFDEGQEGLSKNENNSDTCFPPASSSPNTSTRGEAFHRPPIRSMDDVKALVESRRCHSFENNEDPLGRHTLLTALAPFLSPLIESGLMALAQHIYNRYNELVLREYLSVEEPLKGLFGSSRPTTLARAADLIEFHMRYSGETFYDCTLLIPSSHLFAPCEQEMMNAAHNEIARAEIMLAAAAAARGEEKGATGEECRLDQSDVEALMAAAKLPPSVIIEEQDANYASSGTRSMRSVGVCVVTLLTGVCAADPHMRRLVFGSLLGDEYPSVAPKRSASKFKHVSSGGNDTSGGARAAEAEITSSHSPLSPLKRAAAAPLDPLGEVRGLSLPRMLDAFSEAYPFAIRAFTCWDQSKNGRTQNFGSRIDYILIDEALKKHEGMFVYDARKLARDLQPFYSSRTGCTFGGGHICKWPEDAERRVLIEGTLPKRRPFLLSWEAELSCIYSSGVSVDRARLLNERMALVGLEYGRAYNMPVTAVEAKATLPLTRPSAILDHKHVMRSAAAAAGLYPSAATTGEGMPELTIGAREALFVPQHLFEEYCTFVRGERAALRSKGFSSESSEQSVVAAVHKRFVHPLRTGMFCTPPQYSDHAGVVATLGNISESDCFLPLTAPEERCERLYYYRAAMIEALKSTATQIRRSEVVTRLASQWESLGEKAKKTCGPRFVSPPHFFDKYSQIPASEGLKTTDVAAAVTGGEDRSRGVSAINVSRIITREARDLAFPELTTVMRECTFRSTQRTLMSMFGKMAPPANVVTLAGAAPTNNCHTSVGLSSTHQCVSQSRPLSTAAHVGKLIPATKTQLPSNGTLAAREASAALASLTECSVEAVAEPNRPTKKSRLEVEVIDLDSD